ncbi:hypothetical protein E2P81_ATG07506 [Venturia nashicola]|uniref:Uncharacterized protein n=1 Tax=Venturia nashicola TaxID=86259 RepID=A0A4Z1P1Z3_9PEZI|nr:hypothetical protein E6O75_ATG07663 [Venturia nashicola]TLD32016.1 hypothetical protein E2P81_ATG07506 [Venturia nashicola]
MSPNGQPFANQYQPMEQHIEPGASRNLQPAPPPHILSQDVNGHLHHQYYQDQKHDRHSLATPQTPSQHQSPRFSTLTPAPPSHTFQQSYIPQDRSLPDRNVNEDNITDAYVAFILYCNPCFPLSVDTTLLKKTFNELPASEGVRHNIFLLYKLIRRHEANDAACQKWTHIIKLLGVKEPDTEKKQSHQKLSQFGVRLKRWLKQRHIDAFFGYLNGHELTYSQQIPHPSEGYPESRDGISIADDYALHALDPSTTPKRGRKRADELDDDMEPASAIEPKRSHLDTSVSGSRDSTFSQSAYPSSAPVPMSAHPDGLEGYPHGDPWSAVTPGQHSRSALTASQQQIRWARNETPSTPHPSMTPISAHPDHYFDEPRSAVTPSSSRKRAGRKHGPVTSSAWTSTNTTANGKLRGRPPSNRSVRDGSFGTFPADPKIKEAPTIDLGRNQISIGTPTTGATESPKPQFLTPQQPTPISATTPHSLTLLHGRPAQPLQVRPERLQVQVPENRGGPVSLITPTLLVNGRLNECHLAQDNQQAPESLQTPALSTASTARTMTSTSSFFSNGNESADTDMDDHFDDRDTQHFLPPKTSQMVERGKDLPPTNVLTNEDVKRALATELLQAEISGRTKRLRGQEAKDLAQAMIQRSSNTLSNESIRRPVPSTSPEHTDHLRALATWLGLAASLGLQSPLMPTPQTGGHKRVIVRRFKVNEDGYGSPIDDDSDDEMDDSASSTMRIRESFDVEWSASLGGIIGQFSVKGLYFPRSKDEDGSTAASDDTEIDARSGGDFWKERYLLSEKRLRQLNDENRALKDKVLDAVL